MIEVSCRYDFSGDEDVEDIDDDIGVRLKRKLIISRYNYFFFKLKDEGEEDHEHDDPIEILTQGIGIE